MKHIELYGDSILKGVTYEETQDRYQLCHRPQLDALCKKGYTVKNHSRMGATIHKGISTLERRDRYEDGTVVILEYGGNDCDFNWSQIAENPTGCFTPNTPEKEFLENYGHAVKLAREKGAHVAILSLVPIDADKYFSWICKNKNADNIFRWLGDISMLSRWQEYYSRLVESLADKLHCPLIDIRRDFLLSHRFEKLLSADGIHPTQLGHDMIGNRIAQYMLTI